MTAPSPREASCTSRLASFKHEPLDYRRGAIRLLRILPHLSIDGHIQCEIWHDSVKASYTCLSYVWGSEKIQWQILVNGKLLLVRENIYNFMRVAQLKYANPARTFWIDALCIDQDSIHEKNHQVAQMGSIYAKSIEVISWLGFNQSIGRAFTFGLEMSMDPRYKIWDWLDLDEKWLERNDQTNGQLKRDWLTVVEDRYWTRAWITQEILLAQNVKFLVNDLEVAHMQIAKCALGWLEYINSLQGNATIDSEKWDTKTRVFHHYMNSIGRGRGSPKESKLINYFDSLPGRESHFVHDRVYSLLSLASDASSITIDYRLSRQELLRQVMSIYKTNMCICAWFYFADMLDCYQVPNPKSSNTESGRSPVFQIAWKPVQTDFVMGEKPRDWYHACSQCSVKMTSCYTEQNTTFCLASLCCSIVGGHIYVCKNEYGKYEVRRSGDAHGHEVLLFQPGDPISPEDCINLGWGSLPLLYNIHLTGDVALKLFLYPEQKVRQAVPLRICGSARYGSTNLEFC